MTIGEMFGWAFFGLIAGAIARMIHPGRDPMNWIWTMALGIVGAVLGGWIGSLAGIDARSGLTGWVAAIGGAILVLTLYHLATARRAALGGPATTEDYKRQVFDDLSRGPNG
jgi:uncharacterized membrane protein YeaQ/YmgE (transglycosylase-associated protein family)